MAQTGWTVALAAQSPLDLPVGGGPGPTWRRGSPASAVRGASNGRASMWRRLEIDDAGRGVLRVSGEIDAATAPALERRLAEDPLVTVIDGRRVTFIDAAGLGVLLRADGDRGGLTLRAPSAAIRRLLDLTGLASRFLIEVDLPAPTPFRP